MKSFPLASICFCVPFALSTFRFGAAGKPPTRTLVPNESYIAQYNEQLQNQVPMPIRRETLNVRRNAPGSKKDRTRARLQRREISDLNGFLLVDFDCEIKDENRCDNVKKTVLMGLEIVAKVLVLDVQNPITVKVKFYHFPDKYMHMLGYTTPFRYPAVDPSDKKTRYYPAALLRQLKTQGTKVTQVPDMVIDINAFYDHYFPANDRQIHTHQQDLLTLVLHELIHGLGFGTFWKDTHDTNLSPYMETKSDKHYIYLQNFYGTIFDKFLIDASGSTLISEQSNAFEQVALSMKGKPFKTTRELLSATERHPTFQTSSNVMRDLAEKGLIAFRSKAGTNIELETALPFQVRDRLSHLSTRYITTPDFLMVHTLRRGESLAQQIDETGGDGPIGPKIIEVLETIGYTHREQQFPLDSFSFWINYKECKECKEYKDEEYKEKEI